MKRSTIYGTALVCGSLALALSMILHPAGHDLLSQPDQLARRNEMIAFATHSLALVSLPILLLGFTGLSGRLGRDSPRALLAFIAYALGLGAAMCAAVISGMVAPTLTRLILSSGEPARQILHTVLMANGLLNQACTKVFIVASSSAVIFWSVCISKAGRFARSVGAVGCVVGLVSLVGLFSGHLRSDVHAFGLFVLGQAVWSTLLGVLLARA